MFFLPPSPPRASRLLSIAALILFPLACAPPPAADAGAQADPPPSGASDAGDRELGTTDVATPAAIFIVRHAEKETGDGVGRDPNLNEAGHERASRALVELLDGAAIDAAYVTQWRRTQQTAAPLLEGLGLTPEVLQTDEGFEAALAERLLAAHAGETVLVVGHSDTNPVLIEALGAPPPTIADDDYDDAHLVVFPAPGEPRLIRLGYGRPTP
ncbi:MAG: histidine phosphatase family protein [Acidobacteriota bacterium]